MLGTFVEISAQAGGSDSDWQSMCLRGVETAFRRIEQVESLMSVHNPGSELSRVNREAAHRSVRVSNETYEVLERGLSLAERSEGAFDFTVAPMLARWGYLPPELKRRNTGNWQDLRLLRQQRVRFNQPLALDLGGIAKGYAVDQAITALQESGATSGWVNAGGDLRTFGPNGLQVGLRDPAEGGHVPASILLQNEALATSSPFFSRKNWRGQTVSHLVHPASRSAVAGPIGVSVRAMHCWIADALTKVVLNLTDRKRVERILEQHGATALVFTS